MPGRLMVGQRVLAPFIVVRIHARQPFEIMFYVYILRTTKNTLYIGQTNNLEKRLKEHKSKKSRGAKYTRSFENIELVYKEEYLTRQDAMHREYQLKQLPKDKKEKLIISNLSVPPSKMSF